MTRSILVNGWNLPVRVADFELSEAARNGEVATGGIDVDSQNAGFNVNSHWSVTVQEMAVPTDFMYVGYVGDKELARGPFAIDRDRQFDLNTVDLNTLLIDDIITGASGNRGAETDIARVTWLVGTSFLSGMGATIGASGATNLEAADFRDQNPLSLLTQAAETAGKLFFVYYDHATDGPKLFYDLATASNFITSSKISTFLADSSNSNTYHPIKGSLARRLDGGRIYSEVKFKYDGGSVTVTNSATASNYRARKTVIYDNSVKTSGMATTKANQYLVTAATEEDVITCEVDLPPANIHDIRAGQMMQVKFPHLGLPNFVDRRVVRRSVKPRTDTDDEGYRVLLELSVPKSNRWGARGVPLEILPDAVAGAGDNPAAIESTGCATPVRDGCGFRDDPHGSGNGVKIGTNGADVGSWVPYNIPYTVCGCPLGGGGWDGFNDAEAWYQFTAPADDPDYLGLSVTIDATSLTWAESGPLRGGFNIRVAKGAWTGTRFGEGAQVAGLADGGSVTIYIPRTHITWGAANCFIIAPDWTCARGAFFCNPAATFYGTRFDGRGGSGSASGFVVSDVCALQYVAGTTGQSPAVAGIGAVDGTNKTFTLIDWDGTSGVFYTINGLEGAGALTLDVGAKTVTLDSAPPLDAVVLFRYKVAA